MVFKKMIRKDDSGVSTIIGIILGVGITVMIAGFIYTAISMEGTEENGRWADTSITILKNNNGFIVTKCSENILWSDFSLSTDNPYIRISINDNDPYLVGDNWTKINEEHFNITGYVTAGDSFNFHNFGDADYITVTIRNDVTNILQCRYIVNI